MQAPLLLAALMTAGRALALDCPAMPQQASRDAEVEVRIGVRGIGDARGAELSRRTRALTTDLLGRLPRADRVYLEQMLYASYCSALKANTALNETEREARVQAYAREMRGALARADAPQAPKADPRDAARAELERIPVAYTAEALVDAADRRDARVVNLFIAAGFDVNAQGRDRETALAHAAANGDLAMLNALLKAGAKHDAVVRREESALGWAAHARQPATLRALLALKPNGEIVDDAFVAAASAAWVEGLEILRPAVSDFARLGARALIQTARRSADAAAIAAAQRLLDWGVPINAQNAQGFSLLLEAIHHKNLLLARFALDRGAEVNLRCACEGIVEGGFTPLLYAVLQRIDDAAFIELLLSRGAGVNTRTDSGRTPLLLLLDTSGDAAVLERLLAAGADVQATDEKGRTALHGTAAGPSASKRLLAAGARVDAPMNDGSTPLMHAAYRNATDSVAVLLDAGARIDAQDARGRTALMDAAQRDARDSVRVLVQRGANIAAKDKDGLTAEDLAADALSGDRRTRMLALLRQGKPR